LVFLYFGFGIGLGIGLGRDAFLEFDQIFEAAEEGAEAVGVVALDELEAVRVVGEGAEGCGDGGGVIVAGLGGFEFRDFRGQDIFFDSPDTHLPPAGDGHGFDEGALGFGGGFVFIG
jgi:hypothetical protein